ncbi:MAG: DUF4143 domain-containing protein [Lachnospiraceae bacterium]|nr:DUF4143 domain-containing protein [Lachnospiraceae bacterium]
MTHFKKYVIVDGMPADVQKYVNSGDVNKVDKLQRNIIEMYKLDFTKYEQFENAVIQELTAHGFSVYFYNSHKNSELDFLIEKGGEVVPIEVKSGKVYYVHSAISKACENPEYNIHQAYVLGDCNISQEGKITYYPVYLCNFIRDDVSLPILKPL